MCLLEICPDQRTMFNLLLQAHQGSSISSNITSSVASSVRQPPPLQQLGISTANQFSALQAGSLLPQHSQVCILLSPTWHGPDFHCNFPETVLRPTSPRFTPKLLVCFDSHFLVNTSRYSSQLSVISSKHCLCLQLELRPTGTLVRPKNSSFLGLKT